MAEAIKRKDFIEEQALLSIKKDIDLTIDSLELMNVKLRESAELMGKKLKPMKIINPVDISEANKLILEAQAIKRSMAETERALNENRKAELQASKLIEAQKNKEYTATEKLTRAQERANSAYMKINDKLAKTRKEYRDLAIQKELLNNLSAKEEIRLIALEKRTKLYDNALKKVDASMGNHQRNVGNYASGWTGLDQSISQLVGELPSLSNGFRTFASAIGNNLTPAADAIQRVVQQNKDLKAQGQPTTSVLKQIAGGFLSLNVAVSVGATILTMYGAQMFDYISTLFSAKKATESYVEQQKRLTKQQNEAYANISKESAQYVGLIQTLKRTNAGSKERADLIEKINEKYGTHIQNIKDEAKFQNQLNQTVKDYIDFKRQEFIIQMNETLIGKNLEKQMRIKREIRELNKSITQQELNAAIIQKNVQDFNVEGNMLSLQNARLRKEQLQQELDEAQKRLETYGLNISEADKKRNALDFDESKKTKEKKAKEERDLTREIEDEQMKRMFDSIDKKAAELAVNARRRKEDLDKEIVDDKQRAKLKEEIERNLVRDIAQLYADFRAEQIQKEIDARKKVSEELIKILDEDWEAEKDHVNKVENWRKLEIQTTAKNKEEERKMMLEAEILANEERLKLMQKENQDTTELLIKINEQRQQLQEMIDQQALENRKKYIDLTQKALQAAFDYEEQLHNKRLSNIDKEIKKREEAVNKYREAAKDGSIDAQSSLKAEEKALIEANQKKEEEQKRFQRAIALNTLLQSYGNNIKNGEKNPLIKTITDATVLKAFAGTLASYDVGTDFVEVEGKGIDGKRGAPAIIHHGERVITAKGNTKLHGLSEDQLIEHVDFARNFSLRPQLIKQDYAGTTFDIKPMLNELESINKQLKALPEKMPSNSFEIVEGMNKSIKFIHTAINGNTTRQNVIKYRS